MAGKQAKILSPNEVKQVLAHLQSHRYLLRNKVMFLLSIKAGLRAKEISNLTWSMVTDASSQIGDTIQLPDNASKGKSGRAIPLNQQLKQALMELHKNEPPTPDQYVIRSERGYKMIPCNVSHWFKQVYRDLRLDGCSSHSGRRTFITTADVLLRSVALCEMSNSLRVILPCNKPKII